MWKVEMHCHSAASHDSLVTVERLIAAGRKLGLDRIILTDHNTIRGARRAKGLAPDLIIVGEEVLTTRGELLAFFVSEEVPRGLEPMEVIRRLKAQNAFISVPHPFDRLRHGWELADLQAITPHVDAVEVFNARSFTKTINEQAADYARQHGLAGTVGSDAHTLPEYGQAVLQIPPFHNADELREVIRQAVPITRYSSPLVRLGSTSAKWIKRFRRFFKTNQL